MGLLWSATSAKHFRFRKWDHEDAAIVYNTLSGETHLIAPPGADVLEALTAGPCSSEFLASKLAGMFDDADQAGIAAYMEDTLVQLQAIGLVRATVL